MLESAQGVRYVKVCLSSQAARNACCGWPHALHTARGRAGLAHAQVAKSPSTQLCAVPYVIAKKGLQEAPAGAQARAVRPGDQSIANSMDFQPP